MSLSLISCGNNKVENNSSANKTKKEEKTLVKIASLKGPTSIGLIKIIDDTSTVESDLYDVETKIETSPTALIPSVIKGEYDFAALPLNVALNIHNKTKGEYQLVAVNTLGVLSILSSDDSIENIEDLKGKTVYCGAPNSTPEFALRYLISQSGLSPEDVDINYSMGMPETSQALIGGNIDCAILPEPLATVTTMKNKSVKRVIDVQEEWSKTEDSKDILMGAFVVKKSFNEAHPEFVKSFLEKYEESVDWVNANVDEAGELVAKHEIIPNAKIASLSIPKCNIVFINANEKKEEILSFLKTVYDFDKKFVGEDLPSDSFFFQFEK